MAHLRGTLDRLAQAMFGDEAPGPGCGRTTSPSPNRARRPTCGIRRPRAARVGGVGRLRHGAPQRAAVGRHRPGRLHRVRVRDGHRPDRHGAARRRRPPRIRRGRRPVHPPLRLWRRNAGPPVLAGRGRSVAAGRVRGRRRRPADPRRCRGRGVPGDRSRRRRRTRRRCGRADRGPDRLHEADPLLPGRLSTADSPDAVRGIVCGATNFAVGDRVVVATPGCRPARRLPDRVPARPTDTSRTG